MEIAHQPAQLEAATAAGKLAILCEKPLATTVEEAQFIARFREDQCPWSWGDLPDTATLVCVAV